MLLDEGVFVRLIELIQQKPGRDNELHRLLLELLFEVSRTEKLDADDLGMCCSSTLNVDMLPYTNPMQSRLMTTSFCTFSVSSKTCPMMLMILTTTQSFESL